MSDNGTPNTVQEIAKTLAQFNEAHQDLYASVTIGGGGLLDIEISEGMGTGKTVVTVSLTGWLTAVPDLLSTNLDEMWRVEFHDRGPQEPDQPIDPWTGDPAEREG